MKNLGVGPFGTQGEALGLRGIKLVVAVVGNFIFGALMSIGVGLYAPCMAMVLALGMNAGCAFPAMMPVREDMIEKQVTSGHLTQQLISPMVLTN